MYLKAAIVTFISYKGASMTFDSFKEGCLAVCADLVFTGGMATLAMAMYDAYGKVCTVCDIDTLLQKSKREQAKALLKTGLFANVGQELADDMADDIAEEDGWWDWFEDQRKKRFG